MLHLLRFSFSNLRSTSGRILQVERHERVPKRQLFNSAYVTQAALLDVLFEQLRYGWSRKHT